MKKTQCVWGLVMVLLANMAAGGQEYVFQIDPAASGGSAQLHVSATTSGTLIGNYDPLSTPDGTHTKPGFLQAPGSTENVAVPVNSFNPDAIGTIPFSPTGTFNLSVDTALGTVAVNALAADLLGSKAAGIPVNAAISFNSFRTSNPSSTYLGIPLNLPMGNAVVTTLSVIQVPGQADGTLTPLGGDLYGFSVTPMVILSAKVDFQGSPLDMATDPTAFPLVGQVRLMGETATLDESAPLDMSSALAPDQPLSPLPYDLPGASAPAHLIFSLTLKTESTSVQGTQSLGATGAAVPEPGGIAWMVAMLGGIVLRRHGKRSRKGRQKDA
jgi:hypothetical protein